MASTSSMRLPEATRGDVSAAARRFDAIADIALLPIDEEVQLLAERLVADGGMPSAEGRMHCTWQLRRYML